MVRKTGIPISYVIRDSVAPFPDPNVSILKQYLLMAPHHVPVYQYDNSIVFNIARALAKDIQVGNTNVQILLEQSNGRVLLMAIATNYRGQIILNQ